MGWYCSGRIWAEVANYHTVGCCKVLRILVVSAVLLVGEVRPQSVILFGIHSFEKGHGDGTIPSDPLTCIYGKDTFLVVNQEVTLCSPCSIQVPGR
jgi:hypothetical protein